MPRQARIDAPGALHHIVMRGIEHREIFEDNRDREDFSNIGRFSRITETGKIFLKGSPGCLRGRLLPVMRGR